LPPKRSCIVLARLVRQHEEQVAVNANLSYDRYQRLHHLLVAFLH